MTDERTEAVESRQLDRLTEMMSRWWQGRSLARIGAEYGLSRQRVHQLLASVACTAQMRRQVDRGRPDADRGATVDQVAEARWLLMHPYASRLTPRQRGALAWRAQGLGPAAIGRRLGITGQAADQLIQRALVHLSRLDASGRPPHELKPLEMAVDWSVLLEDEGNGIAADVTV